jgi:Lon protease-like protein
MTRMLPIFPLGSVLYPGLLLPMHIFEDRYRKLVHDLLAEPEPRRFGVIAIREGRETGADGVSALYDIGCTATVRQVIEQEDGRFYLITVGTQRFRLAEVDRSEPYLRGHVDYLPEDTGDREAAQLAVEQVQSGFRAYLDELAERGAIQVITPDLPDEPVQLSYLVAASVIANLSEKQALLAQPDALHRLTTERALLSRENAMLRSLTSAPAPEFRHMPYNSN